MPHYELKEITGQEHEQLFLITCEVKTLNLTVHGQGPTRRKAEQQAAKQLLEMVKVELER